jgi:hypothetical protein
MALGLVACKKDKETSGPNQVIMNYERSSESIYRVVNFTHIDDTTSANNDSEETYIDTLIIRISADTIINSEPFFIRSQIYINSKDTIIHLLKETDSGYVLHATWNEFLQEFQAHTPEIDVLKKFIANNSWYKSFIFGKTEHRIKSIETITSNNKQYLCAKVVPQLYNPNPNFQYNIFYGPKGLVKTIINDKSKLDFGTIESMILIELL